MGKRRKRLTMAKYAKKYALKRTALGLNTEKVENKMITIDMTTGEEVNEKETVQVISNTPEVKEEKPAMVAPEPQLQTIQVEEPETKLPNALITIKEPEKTPEPKKKRATTTRKTTTRRKTTPRKKTTKKKEE